MNSAGNEGIAAETASNVKPITKITHAAMWQAYHAPACATLWALLRRKVRRWLG